MHTSQVRTDCLLMISTYQDHSFLDFSGYLLLLLWVLPALKFHLFKERVNNPI